MAVHHIGMGLLNPTSVFSDPRAQTNPIPSVLLHASLVLMMCAAQMAYWCFAERQDQRLQAERAHSATAAVAARAQAADRRARDALAANATWERP